MNATKGSDAILGDIITVLFVVGGGAGVVSVAHGYPYSVRIFAMWLSLACCVLNLLIYAGIGIREWRRRKLPKRRPLPPGWLEGKLR